jgi:hypothetical protein
MFESGPFACQAAQGHRLAAVAKALLGVPGRVRPAQTPMPANAQHDGHIVGIPAWNFRAMWATSPAEPVTLNTRLPLRAAYQPCPTACNTLGGLRVWRRHDRGMFAARLAGGLHGQPGCAHYRTHTSK